VACADQDVAFQLACRGELAEGVGALVPVDVYLAPRLDGEAVCAGYGGYGPLLYL